MTNVLGQESIWIPLRVVEIFGVVNRVRCVRAGPGGETFGVVVPLQFRPGVVSADVVTPRVPLAGEHERAILAAHLVGVDRLADVAAVSKLIDRCARGGGQDRKSVV